MDYFVQSTIKVAYMKNTNPLIRRNIVKRSVYREREREREREKETPRLRSGQGDPLNLPNVKQASSGQGDPLNSFSV
ncbi:MAG: hypothetical protein A2275_17200 [Bacteroidetes bacterium RIFOXYA12_FULL_35_11]|nr:MAG: hypothetical protein A2X01_06565 [Bacteroidetes bacterium GWF2_35_48]OFY79744.1 MAG: hypothetical protein A2275_17200 [Bacteroidetes bacterium RIFOXYA12_FULL_35_11]HBX49683.1 hypothetical protein [Bacteroidales bacterium]